MGTWNSLTPDRADKLERALNSSNAGGALVQNVIDKALQYNANDTEPGVWATIPHFPATGDRASVPRRTPGTTGGAWVADTDSATEETGTDAITEFVYKTALTKGQVTRALARKSRSWGDALGSELIAKGEDFTGLLEDGAINGNTAGNANQPNGFLTLVQATASQIVAVTSGSAGDSLTADDMDAAISKVRGRSKRGDLRFYCSEVGRRKINTLGASLQQFNDTVEIDGGFRVRSWDGIPIVSTSEMRDDYTFNGTKITGFSGATTTAILLLNTKYARIDDLSPISAEMLARTTTQNDSFEMYWDGAPVLPNSYGGAVIVGISAA